MASTSRPFKKLRLTEATKISIPDYSKDYDVFLSHTGPDTKRDFVSFLDKALKDAGVQPFFDKYDIDSGEDSWKCIESVIKKTPIALVIFTEQFTKSEWCLKELHLMLGSGNTVLPIFYKVKPDDLCNAKALAVRLGAFRSKFDETVIEQWRAALEKASRIEGWLYEVGDERMGAEFVEQVAKETSALLNKRVLVNVGECVIGVHQAAEQIMQALKKKVRMVGLWGVGGIGKSTLARELYIRFKVTYSARCYIENVRDRGVMEVQECILKGLCRNVSWNIEGASHGTRILEDNLQNKTFLLVLDDVWDKDAMKNMITCKMLVKGSMCIVTSRDEDVFEIFSIEEKYIHHLKGLGIADSKLVFAAYAFGRDERVRAGTLIPRGFEELVTNISEACGGVPLLLQVCGARLKDVKDLEIWKEVLDELNCGDVMNDEKISKCLKISYRALEREHQEMFLDIACGLIGQSVYSATKVWKSKGGFPHDGSHSLVQRALVAVDGRGCFTMHDHLRDMGRQIEQGKKAEKRTRLWMPESLSLLKSKKQFPNTLQIMVISNERDKELYSNVLDLLHMKELHTLICDDSIQLNSVPVNLLWLRWTPATKMQGLFTSYRVKFDTLPDSFWDLKRLKVLSLSMSGIASLPALFGDLTNLEDLDMSGCQKLGVLPDSFKDLKQLRVMDLSNSGIASLPALFGELSNLEKLYMSWCLKLEVLPDSFKNLKQLKVLNMSFSRVESLPASFGELRNLEEFYMSGCERLKVLPDSFKDLRLLKVLNMSFSSITSLPALVGELRNLEELYMSGCGMLTVLPNSFKDLRQLKVLNMSFSPIASLPAMFGELSNLEKLDMRGCEKLAMLPDSFGDLKQLKVLHVSESGIGRLLVLLRELTNLNNLNGEFYRSPFVP